MSSETILSGFNQLLGFDVKSLQDGDSEIHLKIADKHLNSAGIVHGGLLATLLDSACGASAYSLLPKTQFSPTTNMSIAYMNAVSSGTIIATGRALKHGSRIINCEAEARCGDTLLAKALVSMQVVERQSRPKAGGGAKQ